jgi:hypothetical protein
MVPGMDQLRRQLKHAGVVLALAGAFFGACRPAGAKPAAASRETELTQFRAGLVQPESLTGGARSQADLVKQFIDALELRDTAALVTLHLTRAEFAWLYYPTNPQSQPPYDLSPGLMWFMEHGNSEKGVRRLLEERAGIPLHVAGYRCDQNVSRQGANTVIGPCVVRRLTAQRDTIDERLFGLIIERGGRYKFTSYANKL